MYANALEMLSAVGFLATHSVQRFEPFDSHPGCRFIVGKVSHRMPDGPDKDVSQHMRFPVDADRYSIGSATDGC